MKSKVQISSHLVMMICTLDFIGFLDLYLGFYEMQGIDHGSVPVFFLNSLICTLALHLSWTCEIAGPKGEEDFGPQNCAHKAHNRVKQNLLEWLCT